MAKKLPWFKFFPGDWSKDADLKRCSKAAKGVWIDMIVLMFECPIRGVLADAGGMPWSDEDIAGAIGGPTGSNLECIAELLTKGVAHRNDRGAIFSRRLVRDEETRRKGKKRVDDHRKRKCNAVVTPSVTHSSDPEYEPDISESKELKKQNKEEVCDFDGEKWVEDILNAHPKPVRGYGYQTAILEKIEKEAKLQFGGNMEKGADFILRCTQAYAETVGTWHMAFNSAKFFGEEIYAWRSEAWPKEKIDERDLKNAREANVGVWRPS